MAGLRGRCAVSALYVQTRELPPSLQSALQSVGYGRRDIAVYAAETTSVACAGGQGQRGFVLLVNLATGSRESHQGSWGGPNMFNPQIIKINISLTFVAYK